MGSIAHCFDAPVDVTFDAFLETGTEHGSGTRWLREHVAPRGITIDIRAPHDLHLPGVTCLTGDSAVLLPEALAAIGDGVLACWLDAHYPWHYGLPPDSATELPLVQELAALLAWRAAAPARRECWVWIDDARIYGYLPNHGPLPPGYRADILDLSDWHATHENYWSSRDEGYLMIHPRDHYRVRGGR